MDPCRNSSNDRLAVWIELANEIIMSDDEYEKLTLEQQREYFINSEQLIMQRALATATPQERKAVEEGMKSLQDSIQSKVDDFRKKTDVKIAAASGSTAARRKIRQRSIIREIIKVKPKTLDCDYLQKEIQSVILTAKHFKIEPNKVTVAQKKEFAAIIANEAFQELMLLSDTETKKKKNSNRRTNRKKPAVKVKEVQPNHKVKNSVSRPMKKEVAIRNIFNESSKEIVAEHGRVTRWATKNVKELRKFSDKVGAETVFKYADLDEEELLLQRKFHYLPGVENLIAFPEAREKYTFKTERGCGLIAKIISDTEVHEGILYLGVDTKIIDSKANHNIYHKYFEKLTTINDIFSGSLLSDFSFVEEREEKWNPVGKFSLNLIDQNQLEILFDDENYKLLVYPVN